MTFLSYRQLIRFLGKYVTGLLAASVVVGVILSVVEVAFAGLIQSFLLSMGVLSQSVTKLPSWAPTTFRENVIFLFGFAVLRAVTQWFKVYAHSLSFEAFAHHLRRLIAEWALLNPNSNTSRVVTFLSERVTSAAAWVTALQNAAIQLCSLTLIVLYLFRTSFVLAAIGLSVLFASGLVLRIFNKRVTAAGNELSRNSLAMNERLIDSLKNLYLLRICRTQLFELKAIYQSLDRYFSFGKLYFAVRGLRFAAPQLIGVAFVIVISAASRKTAILAPGEFVSFIYLFIRTSQTAADFSSTTSAFRMYRSQWNELFKWWNDEWKTTPKPTLSTLPQIKAEARKPIGWRAQDLSFTYGERPILRSVNFEIIPGQLIAITGPSGIGKSTLIDLLAGIRKPNDGVLTLIGSSSFDDVRFGYVGPEPHVIAGEIRENLQYGLGFSVSDHDLIKALELAHCTEFLTQLPTDLSRQITDRGEGLSAGQKQRLALARALLRQPQALMLDEPTANLDLESEKAVVDSLKAMKGATTIVVVTHRDAILKFADQTIRL